jgi:hypothetical protein
MRPLEKRMLGLGRALLNVTMARCSPKNRTRGQPSSPATSGRSLVIRSPKSWSKRPSSSVSGMYRSWLPGTVTKASDACTTLSTTCRAKRSSGQVPKAV